MPLTLPEISRIARDLIEREGAGRVEVDGVTRVEGGSSHAEVVLTVRPAGDTDRRGQRSVLVQVRRHDPEILRSDLRRRLARALRSRPADH